MDKKALLKSKNLHVTDFRLAVLELFDRFENAISIEQIENEMVDFDRVTLYRTIKSFKDKGLIHEIALPDNIKKLALCADKCVGAHHHHEHIHFHCESCEEIFCVEIPQFPTLDIPGFSIHNLEIQASGTCQNCR